MPACYSPRFGWGPIVLALLVVPMWGVVGCTPVVDPGTGQPAGPTMTDTRVAPAGGGVAMLDLFGNWFFILRTPDGEAVFTQRGDFALRADGKLVYDGTWYAQGFKADEEGELRTDKLRDLKIVIGEASPVRATTRVRLAGNVNPEDADVGDAVVDTSFRVFDAQGAWSTVYVLVSLTGKSDSETSLQFDVRLGSASGTLLARATLRFDGDGAVVGQSVVQVSSGSPTLSFNLELDAMQASSRRDPSLAMTSQDGLGTGTLQSYTIGNDGGITGRYSNGLNLLLGQFVIAAFDSPSELAPVAGRSDLFTETAASGSPRPAISVAE